MGIKVYERWAYKRVTEYGVRGGGFKMFTTISEIFHVQKTFPLVHKCFSFYRKFAICAKRFYFFSKFLPKIRKLSLPHLCGLGGGGSHQETRIFKNCKVKSNGKLQFFLNFHNLRISLKYLQKQIEIKKPSGKILRVWVNQLGLDIFYETLDLHRKILIGN